MEYTIYTSPYKVIPMRNWFSLRSNNVKQYFILVACELLTFEESLEFSADADKVLLDKFFHGEKTF